MRHEGPTWLGGIGALLVAILCTVATGLPGFIAGIVFFLLWYTVPTLYTVAFGQLVVAALSDSMAVEYLVALELGLLAVLVAPSLTFDRPYWRVAVTSGVAALFGVGALSLDGVTDFGSQSSLSSSSLPSSRTDCIGTNAPHSDS